MLYIFLHHQLQFFAAARYNSREGRSKREPKNRKNKSTQKLWLKDAAENK